MAVRVGIYQLRHANLEQPWWRIATVIADAGGIQTDGAADQIGFLLRMRIPDPQQPGRLLTSDETPEAWARRLPETLDGPTFSARIEAC